MRTDYKQELPLVKGVNQSTPPRPDGAEVLQNFCASRRFLGWDNRLGIESIITQLYGFGNFATFSQCASIQSVFAWSSHRGAKEFLLYEEQDKSATDVRKSVKLKMFQSNGPSAITIDSNRSLPATNQIGSYYEPYGKFLIIVNGQDEPIKFDGYKKNKLGFHTLPTPPRPWQVASAKSEISNNDENKTLIPMLRFPPQAGNGNVGIAGEDGFRDNLRINFGLGSTDENAQNTYRYAVTFVKEDGSESPLSPSSEPVMWQTIATDPKQGVWVENIARGNQEEGVVARRIYRTKNLGDSTTAVGTDLYVEQEVYYFVTQLDNNTDTHFFDTTPDGALGALAVRPDMSVLFPARPTMAATFKGSLFVDGGEGDGGTLFYSVAGKPCQYQALDYFSVGSSEGGEITGLRNFNDTLLVFREKAIDMVIGDPVDGFKYVPIAKGLGCRSRHGSVVVPNAGCFFLSDDGIYLIRGTAGVSGSDSQISKVSNDLQDWMSRLTKENLYKAQAIYSKKWNEVHFYTSVDGSAHTNIGFIFHPDLACWSVRSDDFKVNAITTDHYGEIIYGSWEGYSPASPSTDPDEAGLYFISAKRSAGTFFDSGSDAVRAKDPFNSKFRSIEHNFGYGPAKKAVKYLYLYLLAEGDNTLPITYYADRDIKNPITSQGQKIQPPELEDQQVYGTAIYNNPTAVWERKDLITLRYDIANKKLSYFKFEFETSNDIEFMGYSLEFNVDQGKTRQGKS